MLVADRLRSFAVGDELGNRARHHSTSSRRERPSSDSGTLDATRVSHDTREQLLAAFREWRC